MLAECVCGVVYPLLNQKVLRGFVRCSQVSEICFKLTVPKLQCAQELFYIFFFYFAFYPLNTFTYKDGYANRPYYYQVSRHDLYQIASCLGL